MKRSGLASNTSHHIILATDTASSLRSSDTRVSCKLSDLISGSEIHTILQVHLYHMWMFITICDFESAVFEQRLILRA
jgi:hypothetical protein